MGKTVFSAFPLIIIGILGKNFNGDSEQPKSGVTVCPSLARSSEMKQCRMESVNSSRYFLGMGDGV